RQRLRIVVLFCSLHLAGGLDLVPWSRRTGTLFPLADARSLPVGAGYGRLRADSARQPEGVRVSVSLGSIDAKGYEHLAGSARASILFPWCRTGQLGDVRQLYARRGQLAAFSGTDNRSGNSDVPALGFDHLPGGIYLWAAARLRQQFSLQHTARRIPVNARRQHLGRHVFRPAVSIGLERLHWRYESGG